MRKYSINDTLVLNIIQGQEAMDYIFFKGDAPLVVVDYDEKMVYLESDGKLYPTNNTLFHAIDYIERKVLIPYETETY